MKWIYRIKHKMAASALLFVVLGLVFINNISERENSAQINRAISDMYGDRLIPGSYILQLSEKLHELAEISRQPETGITVKKARASSVITSVFLLNEDYGKTKLTTREAEEFNRFTSLCTKISEHCRAGDFTKIGPLTEEAQLVLNALSEIQVAEAQTIMKKSSQLFHTAASSSQFEMAVLIIIALIIQAMIFASDVPKSKHVPRHPQLN